jgi:hypothetical protein
MKQSEKEASQMFKSFKINSETDVYRDIASYRMSVKKAKMQSDLFSEEIESPSEKFEEANSDSL